MNIDQNICKPYHTLALPLRDSLSHLINPCRDDPIQEAWEAVFFSLWYYFDPFDLAPAVLTTNEKVDTLIVTTVSIERSPANGEFAVLFEPHKGDIEFLVTL